MIRVLVWLTFSASIANADVLVATRVIPANAVISADDIQLRDVSAPSGIQDPNLVIGMEARKALFAGRPILNSDIGVPAVVERNQLVQLVFRRSGLVIRTDGRAMGRAGPGDIVRVMNLASRSLVTAKVDAEGVAHVLQ